MKLYFMKDEVLSSIKGNVEQNLENYLNKNNRWIYEKYDTPFLEFKLEVDDFQMDTSNESPVNTDYNNVKILYSALKSVSDTQASDERLWAGLAHGALWNYSSYRLNLKENKINKERILNNFFFNHGNKRSLIINQLSRLWWVGRLVYDDSAKDPYHALGYLRKDFSTKVLTLFSSNYSNNPKITRAILKALAIVESDGVIIDRPFYIDIIRYVNMLGGIIILDYLSEEELRNKVIGYCKNRVL